MTQLTLSCRRAKTETKDSRKRFIVTTVALNAGVAVGRGLKQKHFLFPGERTGRSQGFGALSHHGR